MDNSGLRIGRHILTNQPMVFPFNSPPTRHTAPACHRDQVIRHAPDTAACIRLRIETTAAFLPKRPYRPVEFATVATAPIKKGIPKRAEDPSYASIYGLTDTCEVYRPTQGTLLKYPSRSSIQPLFQNSRHCKNPSSGIDG